VKLTAHLQQVPRSRKRDLYIHSPIRLCGVLLSKLSTGKTLPFTTPSLFIITGKTAVSAPQPSLEDSARFDRVFSPLDFATIFFFTEQGRQPCLQPPKLEGTSLYFCPQPPKLEGTSLYLCPPVTGWSSYTPGTGFSSRRFLRLAVLRWRYSYQLPQGINLSLHRKLFYILRGVYRIIIGRPILYMFK
jgi:hypothetical protein